MRVPKLSFCFFCLCPTELIVWLNIEKKKKRCCRDVFRQFALEGILGKTAVTLFLLSVGIHVLQNCSGNETIIPELP